MNSPARNTTPSGSSDRVESESRKTERVLVPLLDETKTERNLDLDLALAFAAGSGAEIRLLNPVVLPEQTPLTLPDPMLEAHRDVADAAFHAIVESSYDVPVTSGIRVGRSIPRIVASVVADYAIDAVVLNDIEGPESIGSTRSLGRQVARAAGCDVVTANGVGDFERLASILVPVAGGPHSGFAVDVASALSRTHGAWIDLIHIVSSTSDDSSGDRTNTEKDEINVAGDRYLRAALDRLDDTERVDTQVLESDDVAGTIIEQSRCYDLTVFGAPQKGRLRRFVGGSTTDDVRAAATTPVVTVRCARSGPWYHQWIGDDT